jgi:ABC-type Fe3+/spermidine/putrescine transport system ATPase subunit
MSKLTLRGIEKRFGGVAAVAGLDLDLAEGEFV